MLGKKSTVIKLRFYFLKEKDNEIISCYHHNFSWLCSVVEPHPGLIMVGPTGTKQKSEPQRLAVILEIRHSALHLKGLMKNVHPKFSLKLNHTRRMIQDNEKPQSYQNKTILQRITALVGCCCMSN